MFTLSYIMLKGFIFKKAHQRHSSHKDRHTIKSVSVVLRCFLFLHKNIFNLNITYRKPGCVILRCLCTVLYLQKTSTRKRPAHIKEIFSDVSRFFIVPFLCCFKMFCLPTRWKKRDTSLLWRDSTSDVLRIRKRTDTKEDNAV